MRPASSLSLAALCALALAFLARASPLTGYQGSCANYSAFGGKLPDQSIGSNGELFFSWDHVPVYAHLASATPGGLSDALVSYISSHPFAQVTIDHNEGIYGSPVGAMEEVKIENTSRRIRNLNDKVPLIWYMNTVKDLGFYSFFCQTSRFLLKTLTGSLVTLRADPGPHPIANCNTGKVSIANNDDLFDWSQPGLLNLWAGEVSRVTSLRANDQPLYSGVFMDRVTTTAYMFASSLKSGKIQAWNANHDLAVSQVINAFSPPRGIAIVNNENFGNFTSAAREYEQWLIRDFTKLSMVGAILDMATQAAAGRTLFASANPCGPDVDSSGNPIILTLDNGIVKSARYLRAMSLAGFLVAACKRSYYSCFNLKFNAANYLSSYHDCWYNEFNKPLGPPLGAAKRVIAPQGAQMFYRRFASGTFVVFKAASSVTTTEGSACICWGDGSSTCSDSHTTCSALLVAVKALLSPTEMNSWVPDGCA